jgi:hypothetical protein
MEDPGTTRQQISRACGWAPVANKFETGGLESGKGKMLRGFLQLVVTFPVLE